MPKSRREMVISGDYVTPRDDFELYFEKPPLVYWAEAASIHVFGVSEFAVRLPAALFSIGQVIVTAALAEVMLGATAGFFSRARAGAEPRCFSASRASRRSIRRSRFFLTAALAVFYFAARDGFVLTTVGSSMAIDFRGDARARHSHQRPNRIGARLRESLWFGSRLNRRLRQVAADAARLVRPHLRGDRHSVVHLDGSAKSRLHAFLLHPRASRTATSRRANTDGARGSSSQS